MKINYLIALTLSVLLLFSNNNSSANYYLSIISDFFLYLYIIYVFAYFFIIVFFRKRVDVDFLKIFLLISFVVLIYFISSLYLSSSNKYLGFYRGLQILTVFFTMYFFYVYGTLGKANNIFRVQRIFIKVLFVIILIYSLYENSFTGFSAGLLNPNGFGMWACMCTLVLFSATEKKLNIVTTLFILIGFYLILISSSRTSFLAILVGAFVMLVPKRVLYSKSYPNLIMFTIFIFSFFVVFFTLIYNVGSYNEEVVSITGKNLASGRQLVWPIIVDEVKSSPLIGLGAGINLSDFSNFDYSAHNYFLQILMQVGVLGLFLIVFIINSIFSFIKKSKNSVFYKLSLGAFSSLLIMQSFEVTLTQNNLALSLPIWAIIGLVYGDSKYIERSGLDERKVI